VLDQVHQYIDFLTLTSTDTDMILILKDERSLLPKLIIMAANQMYGSFRHFSIELLQD